MFSTKLFQKSVSAVAMTAVMTVFSMVTLASAPAVGAELTVVGQVTVNGSAAVSGSTIASGSTISTGEGSSATINLGKMGRIELLANSALSLNFNQGQMTVVMSSGKARLMNTAGVATTVATKHVTVIADAAQSNSFGVEIECAHTHVDTFAGLVTMRTGNSDKQVAAGSNSIAGNAEQTGCQPCYRPDKTPLPVASIGSLPVAAILLLVGGTIGTAILVGTKNDNENTGTGVVVSPVR